MEATANSEPLELWERLRLFERVYQADYFEKFLAQKYIGKKRFSLEGGESLISLLDTAIETAGQVGLEHLVLGMAHRGRLNVLVNILQKPAGLIFAEFEENYEPGTLDYSDVKYHLGFSSNIMTRTGREVHLSLAFNPSHLEAVNPVALGSVRARQDIYGDAGRTKYMPILIHGDAAFPGQGVVSETLNMMNLNGYTVGGTLHIILNNQIGFTTNPQDSRSTRYATDLAKGFNIPIFHVNGDDPEAVNRILKLSIEFRERFHKDVIIDLVCYRRLGHNETDEPTFTQPLLYEKIKKQPPVAVLYQKKLLEDPEISGEDLQFIRDGVHAGLEESFNKAKVRGVKMESDTLKGLWSNYSGSNTLNVYSGADQFHEELGSVAKALTTPPKEFYVHPKLERLFETRERMFAGEFPVDWGFAELLSLGSLLLRGFNIRFAGQDVKRGTFSHRHAALADIKTDQEWISLNHIRPEQGKIEMVNSPLSEFSVLGFEYGYSLSYPGKLVIWEAQFGDFANSAQIIIDQFISSSEVKWRRMSGLVVLLPHGYEGQGPEHSSARMERFLQLCASGNMQVCNCTTPAQYFHLLRRQMLRSFRKPLIIFSPKSLLRLPEAGSALKDLTDGAFHSVLPESEIEPAAVKRVIFCTGKIYYELLRGRAEAERNDTAILRIEELYPFPESDLKEILGQYSGADEFFWVQEEPENMGAWNYIEKRLQKVLPVGPELSCIAREESPSPAAGLMKLHKMEQEKIVERSFRKMAAREA